jgi:hypothetical protein
MWTHSVRYCLKILIWYRFEHLIMVLIYLITHTLSRRWNLNKLNLFFNHLYFAIPIFSLFLMTARATLNSVNVTMNASSFSWSKSRWVFFYYYMMRILLVFKENYLILILDHSCRHRHLTCENFLCCLRLLFFLIFVYSPSASGSMWECRIATLIYTFATWLS